MDEEVDGRKLPRWLKNLRRTPEGERDQQSKRSKSDEPGTSTETPSFPQNDNINPAFEPPPPYNMGHKHRGIAVIINNEDFGSPDLKRDGSHMDADKLSEVFDILGFCVIKRNNLKQKEMLDLLKDVAQLKINEEGVPAHAVSDCFACALLSHGSAGEVMGTDGKKVSMEALMAPFKGNLCTSLVGKPKLFFVQACQGVKQDAGVPKGYMPTSDYPKMIPVECDFLLAYCSSPGFVGWRNRKEGAWFIQAFYEIFIQCKLEEGKIDLLKFLVFVSNKVAHDYLSSTQKKQVPFTASTLTAEIYFPPKHNVP